MNGDFERLQDESNKRAGAALRRLREEAGLSQEELAADANLDQSRLSKLERLGPHVVSFHKLTEVARALNCIIEVKFLPLHKESQDR